MKRTREAVYARLQRLYRKNGRDFFRGILKAAKAIRNFQGRSVNLQDRLKAKQVEDAKHIERMALTSRMIPMIVDTVEKFTSMGASPAHVVRLLQATIEEMITWEKISGAMTSTCVELKAKGR